MAATGKGGSKADNVNNTAKADGRAPTAGERVTQETAKQVWARGWRWALAALPTAIALGLLVLVLFILYQFLQRAGDQANPLSQLEQTFFGLLTLFTGAGLSWIIAAYYARHQAQERYEQLAKPALRRVQAAKASAALLLQGIERRKERSEEADVAELFTSLHENVQQHARVLDDAVTDWRDILPEEVASIREVDRQLAALEESQKTSQAALETKLSDIASSLAQLQQQPSATPADVQKLAGKIAEVEKLARDAGTTRISSSFLTTSPSPALGGRVRVGGDGKLLFGETSVG